MTSYALAPRPSGAALAPRPYDPAALTLFDLLYGERHGFVELSSIEGDPRPRCGGIYRKQGYYAWPAQRIELAQDAAWYALQHGNVYVSSTLYADKTRKTPLPSPVLFLDDAPDSPALPYSAVVHTSASGRHAYYIADQALDNVTRCELSRRAARALGSDKSGVDLQQIVRVPGGYNTKAHGRFPVQLASISDRVYTVAELESAFPAISAARLASGDSTPDATHNSAAWADGGPVALLLGNIGALLNADGLPRRFTNRHGQARRVLTGELTPMNTEGQIDTSTPRAFVARGLVLHGYPDDEIRALLWHFCDYGTSAAKGTAWLECDIDRLIARERGLQPNIKASASRMQFTSSPAARPKHGPLARKSRARKDRPTTLDADALLAWYTERASGDGWHLSTRRGDAGELHISTATLDRLDNKLESSGRISIETTKDRRGRVVRLAESGVINIAKPGAFEVLSAQPIYSTPAPEMTLEGVHGGTHRPPLDLAAPADAAPDPGISQSAGELHAGVDPQHGHADPAPICDPCRITRAAPVDSSESNAPLARPAPAPEKKNDRLPPASQGDRVGGGVCLPVAAGVPTGDRVDIRATVAAAVAAGATRRNVVDNVQAVAGEHISAGAILWHYEQHQKRQRWERLKERVSIRAAGMTLKQQRRAMGGYASRLASDQRSGNTGRAYVWQQLHEITAQAYEQRSAPLLAMIESSPSIGQVDQGGDRPADPQTFTPPSAPARTGAAYMSALDADVQTALASGKTSLQLYLEQRDLAVHELQIA